MRKKIKSELINLTTNENIRNENHCIVNNNKIKYKDNDNIKYEIYIKNNEVIIVRDNHEFNHAMQFKKDKICKSDYLLKKQDLKLELNIKTIELNIKDKLIYIKYEILESNNIFEYKIKLEDII